MDFQDYGPWLIVGGYALAVVLLLAGDRLSRRARPVSSACLAVAGVIASATTLFWLTAGTFSGPFMYVWALAPLVLVGLVWARRYRQGEWMDRLAGRTGSYWNADRPGHPSFGVLPAQGRPVPADDGRAAFVSAIEVELHGLQLLGVQYGYSQPPRRLGAAKQGRVDQAIDIAEGTYCAVELRTPPVSSLVVTPRAGADRQAAVGVQQAGDVRPFEDARLTRNTFGAFTPGELQDVEGIGEAFDVQFAVRTSDPEFARAVLTPEVQRHILGDPWFRVREVVWHGGALYTAEAGQLSETGLLANSRHLTQLAAVVPGLAWRHDGFAAAARAADTTTAGWYDGRRSLTTMVNERRIAANRVPLSPWSIVVRSSIVLILLVVCVAAIADGSPDTGDAIQQGIVVTLFFGGAALLLAKLTFLPKIRKTSPQPAERGA